MTSGCKNFKYVTYIDCYDGRHPNVFCPSEQPHDEFTSIEEINNYLLQHKEVIDRVERRGGKPKLVFLMFDENTEKLAKELGWQVWFPKAKLRNRVDNKIETVRIGNKAGVPSVPNTLAEVKDWSDLQRLATRAGIGTDLVLQSAFGDSGHTTFFIQIESRFRQARARDRRAGRDEDHETDQLPRIRDRSLRDQGRNHCRAADDGARRLQGIDALPGGLVRQRDLAQSFPPEDLEQDP